MRVAIASDHAGFEQKQQLAAYLAGQGHEVIDKGPATGERCDYPDYAQAVALALANDEADRGVLVCGTGLGMSMAANKVTGARALPVQTTEFAQLAREHNDANIICLSGRFVDLDVNKRICDVFLTTKFAGGRHAMRVAKVMQLDSKPTVPLGSAKQADDVLPFKPCKTIGVEIGSEASPFRA